MRYKINFWPLRFKRLCMALGQAKVIVWSTILEEVFWYASARRWKAEDYLRLKLQLERAKMRGKVYINP